MVVGANSNNGDGIWILDLEFGIWDFLTRPLQVKHGEDPAIK